MFWKYIQYQVRIILPQHSGTAITWQATWTYYDNIFFVSTSMGSRAGTA